jgi:tetratricopeptide (TPR) repeat protein
MTPEEYKILTDRFDEAHGLASANGQLTGNQPDSADAETLREWEILRLARAAIHLHALTEQVKAVRTRFQAAEDRQTGPNTQTGPNAETGPNTESAPNAETAPNTHPAPKRIHQPHPIREIPAASVAKVRRIISPAMQIAAVFVVVMGLAVVIKIANTRPQGIFENNYTAYELAVTRGEDASKEIEKAYRAKNWGALYIAFQTTHTKTQEDYFLTAMAHMEQKDYYEAISLLKTLIQYNASREPLFQDEAEYYLAMNYLATGQSQQALDLFNKIKADPGHLFHTRVMNMSAVDMHILQVK